MQLTEYMQQSGRGTATRLAKECGVSIAAIGMLYGSRRGCSPKLAVAIEQATGGMVRREELRPRDAHLIWPDVCKPPHIELADNLAVSG